MEKFQLSLLYKIIGIGSASGLVYLDDKLYIISDNSNYLYEYYIPDAKLNKIALVENAKENILKKEKPDFEAITKKGKKLLLFGSGSTDKRAKMISFHLDNKTVKEKDLSDLYKKIKQKLNIADDDLNIEGIIIFSSDIFLFQRGNGENGKNGIIVVVDNDEAQIKFIPFELPKIKNVPATFTDAILVDDTIYFLAVAEDTNSTYEDGEVLGSIIGTIDLNSMKLLNYIQISDKHKFEGLTLYKKTATRIELLLCEDNDTEELSSTVYKLFLNI